MRSARKAMFGEIETIRKGLQYENRVLADLIAAEKLEREAIEEQLGRIASLRQDTDRRVVEHFVSIKALLEPDQHEAFNDVVRRAFAHDIAGRHSPKGRHGFHGREKRGM